MNNTHHDKLASIYEQKRKTALMDNADLLSKLAFKYESDRCPQIKHPFTPFYYQLLKDKRKSIKKVLEIGVGYREMDFWRSYRTGAGLFMWRDFFSNAQIYGADNDPRAKVHATRIKTFLCDQSNKENLLDLIKQIGTDIDLVIDDGSHIKEDQIFTCQTLIPLLKKDVIYIIEDAGYAEKISDVLSSQYDCFIPKLRARFSDDKLVVVTNKK